MTDKYELPDFDEGPHKSRIVQKARELFWQLKSKDGPGELNNYYD